jgi:hypothetical protein
MSAPKIRLIDEPSVGLATVLVKRTIEKIKELKDLYPADRADGRAEFQSGRAHCRPRKRSRASRARDKKGSGPSN